MRKTGIFVFDSDALHKRRNIVVYEYLYVAKRKLFSKNDENQSHFEGLKIMDIDGEYNKKMAQYLIISLATLLARVRRFDG